MKKSICIISFSNIRRDGRVLRQIQYLAPHYNLTVIGYGQPHPSWKSLPGVQFCPIESEGERTNRDRLVDLGLSLLGAVYPRVYERWYWRRNGFRKALGLAASARCDAYHANEWEALPVAAEAARCQGSKLVFDAHEFSPLMYEKDWKWELFYAPQIRYLLRKYVRQAEASMTVGYHIAERYKTDFGIHPMVVLNAPEAELALGDHKTGEVIRLIHHGSAMRDRKLETMVQAVALSDPRFQLHFMLVEHSAGYINDLRELADTIAPGRVFFHDPVPPERVIHSISEYDIGFYLLVPTSFNNRMALPNKFFDFIVAGLAVCIGPSPEMADLVKQLRFGIVSPSFEPKDTAKALSALTTDQIESMRDAAREAAKSINARIEMNKVIACYHQLIGTA